MHQLFLDSTASPQRIQVYPNRKLWVTKALGILEGGYTVLPEPTRGGESGKAQSQNHTEPLTSRNNMNQSDSSLTQVTVHFFALAQQRYSVVIKMAVRASTYLLCEDLLCENGLHLA